MLLQRLSTGATGVKQARYRQGPTRAARHSYAHAHYTLRVLGTCSVAVQCETWHGVMPASSAAAYEFRRGFCTLVLLRASQQHTNLPAVVRRTAVYPAKLMRGGKRY